MNTVEIPIDSVNNEAKTKLNQVEWNSVKHRYTSTTTALREKYKKDIRKTDNWFARLPYPIIDIILELTPISDTFHRNQIGQLMDRLTNYNSGYDVILRIDNVYHKLYDFQFDRYYHPPDYEIEIFSRITDLHIYDIHLNANYSRFNEIEIFYRKHTIAENIESCLKCIFCSGCGGGGDFD